MFRTAQGIFPFVQSEVELELCKLVLSGQILIFIVIEIRFGLVLDFGLELVQQVHWFLAFVILDVPRRSKLEQKLDDFLVYSVVLLVIYVPYQSQVERCVALVVSLVYIRPKTQHGLNIALFYAHYCVVKWGRAESVCDVRVETTEILLQVIYGYDAFFPLCSTMQACQFSFASRLIEIDLVLFMQDL